MLEPGVLHFITDRAFLKTYHEAAQWVHGQRLIAAAKRAGVLRHRPPSPTKVSSRGKTSRT